MKNRLMLVPVILVPLLMGCGSTSVKRMDVAEVKDISGRWNDTDSQLTAEEMIRDCTTRPWIQNAVSAQNGSNPSVVVGTVRNQSSEHINTDTFVENLQRSLINSGKVNFVASKAERGEIRGERLEQDTNASEETRKAHGQEIGADYMLSGIINSIEDREDNKEVVYYQVNLKLLDVKTNQIVWNGEKKIKKYVKRAKASW